MISKISLQRWVLGVMIALVLCLAALESFSRIVLGLGSPPLSVAHPAMEYMFKPNQEVERFHNLVAINEYGMRSPPMASSSHSRLVLAFGDSVLNGGSLTDQSELATTIASSRLSERGAKTLVGNVSAGSWGPGNIRGWIDTYGLLGADTIILVLSSHDISDQPTFAPLDPNTHPTHPPRSALLEGVERYLPRYLPTWTTSWIGATPQRVAAKPGSPPPPADGSADLEAILDLTNEAGVRVCLIQHFTLTEFASKPEPGYHEIGAIFDRRSVPRVDDARWLGPEIDRKPKPYRDNIHVSAAGQALLADALIECDRVAAVPSAGNS